MLSLECGNERGQNGFADLREVDEVIDQIGEYRPLPAHAVARTKHIVVFQVDARLPVIGGLGEQVGVGQECERRKRMHAFDQRLSDRWRTVTLSIGAVEFDTADRRYADRQLGREMGSA
jgi:hypothetical protein